MSLALRNTEHLLQDEATTGNGTAVTCPVASERHIVSCRGSGTITGGTISIEEAHIDTYTGDWSVIQTVNAVDIDSDAEKDIHIDGKINAIRARISSDIIGGGNVTVGYKGN